MKKNHLLKTLMCLIAVSMIAATDTKVLTGKVDLHFSNVVDNIPLKLNDTSAKYLNANKDTFTVSTFKYYVSNIVLTTTAGKKVAIPETYYLIDAADPASLDHTLNNVPAGKYEKVAFTIGVDSVKNFSGVQTGPLDPAKGMFWTWNTGYIFLKLEGSSPQSNAKFKKLTFHVGGIKRQNTLRTFTHQFSSPMEVFANKSTALNLKADAGKLFSGKNLIDFSKLSYTMGGPNAVLLADNYMDSLFSVEDPK